MEYSRPKTVVWFFLIVCIFLMNHDLLAQTTGKIIGYVENASTGEPLAGVNIFIEGMSLGAASDLEGDFYILNVPPGRYVAEAQMVGFKSVKVADVIVSVNRTTNIVISMTEAVLEGETIEVFADKIAVKKDQTSSMSNVSSEQIAALPVENLEQVIEMQTGIVDGHFRGGRLSEVSYLIDGMQVDEVYAGEDKLVQIEPEAAQDLEVITGAFNAEYGRAMSGIVNVVTKDGRKDFHGSAIGYISNYVTSHKDVWIGLDDFEITRNEDVKLQLEGPIWDDNITFFTNFRYQKQLGWINGIRRFSVDDYTDFTTPNKFEETTPWDADINGVRYYSEHTGDNAYVPINTVLQYSFLGKLSFQLASNLRASLMGTWNYDERPTTGHQYKYKPDGRGSNYKETAMAIFQLNHLISNSMFHDFKVSYSDNENKFYLYEDPMDPAYVHRGYSSGAGGFSSGGQDYGHNRRTTQTLNIKYDLSWQVNKSHFLKTGILATGYRLHNEPTLIQNALRGSPLAHHYEYDPEKEKVVFYPYQAEFVPDSSIAMDDYTKEPYEISAYLQDKMEFDDMVINLGARMDYFDPNTTYPSQRRNPANQLNFYEKDQNGNILVDDNGQPILDMERMSSYPKAEPQVKISPRFGLAYTVGKAAVLHFSYGHFFQTPPLYALYSNYRNMVPPNDFGIVHGNPELKAEKTVQYEMGVWLELMPRMGIEVSVYYKDIYDLLSAVVYTTYNQIKYGVYSNKDYGNAKGFELKFDYNTGPFALFLNYTLQYTRGNADNPTSTYSREGQSLDPIPYLVPLNWDQRHTANLSLMYSKQNFGLTLTGYVNSGQPFTFRPISISPLAKQTLYPNNSERPNTYTVDFKGHYDFRLGQSNSLRLYLSIYNLLDSKNELFVNSNTGRAYTAIIYPTAQATFRSNYNDIYDSVQNPYMFAPPREIKFGLGFIF